MTLTVRAIHQLLDLSSVPAWTKEEIRKEEERLESWRDQDDEALEALLPDLPDILQMQDLDCFGMWPERLMALRRYTLGEHGEESPGDLLRMAGWKMDDRFYLDPSLHEEEFSVRIGRDEWWLRYLCSDQVTYRCYDCLRPLALFQLARFDPTYPRGYCTRHTLHRFVVRPRWNEDKREGGKPISLEKYIEEWERRELQEWIKTLRIAWQTEKDQASPRYVAWRDQQMRRMRAQK